MPATPAEPPGGDVIAEADRLIGADDAFAAHEVLEDAWRAAPSVERDFWQGLTQLAVGLTHGGRGNAYGCVALLRRGVERLTTYAGRTLHDVDVDLVRGAATALADAVERDGLGILPPAPAFRLRSG
jgi:uncharacterized protein